jgi:hypothetical protein
MREQFRIERRTGRDRIAGQNEVESVLILFLLVMKSLYRGFRCGPIALNACCLMEAKKSRGEIVGCRVVNKVPITCTLAIHSLT